MNNTRESLISYNYNLKKSYLGETLARGKLEKITCLNCHEVYEKNICILSVYILGTAAYRMIS